MTPIINITAGILKNMKFLGLNYHEFLATGGESNINLASSNCLIDIWDFLLAKLIC